MSGEVAIYYENENGVLVYEKIPTKKLTQYIESYGKVIIIHKSFYVVAEREHLADEEAKLPAFLRLEDAKDWTFYSLVKPYRPFIYFSREEVLGNEKRRQTRKKN